MPDPADLPTPTNDPVNSSAADGDPDRRDQESTVWDAAHRPESVGPYRILGLLGTGGMGVVYLAERDKPRRQVALKVIQPERLSPAALRRFEYESEVLARLSHPGIAQVFEAGIADTSAGPRPYFAMEYVKGLPLLAFAKMRHVDLRGRLELFAKVCEAVEHAHQKGVIHRDLKPANILVADEGQPKVLDFGVARVTGADGRPSGLTDVGQLIGTIDYMSPEQATADPRDLDTRSDVYSLGVVLYQLLAERLPYPVQNKPVAEAVRIISEDDPVPLGSVVRACRGDLQTIAAKALEKDKRRRYQSAADLGRDVQRYLHDEPIQARPASSWYQVRQFARRNRALVGGVLTALLLLLFGIVGTSYGLYQARQESERARGEEERANQEKERAREAEAARTRELANSVAQSARLATRRGDWEAALGQYARALELGAPDEIDLRLGRLDCLVALYRIAEVRDEVEALSRRTDLGEHEGSVLLWQALIFMYGAPRLGRPHELVPKALARGLKPVEREYAQVFTATTAPEAIAHLQKALEIDPFYARAYDPLLMLLLLSGRLDEAAVVLGQARLVLPRSANLLSAEALVTALRGDTKGAQRAMDRIEKEFGPKPAALLRPVITMFSAVAREDFHWQGLTTADLVTVGLQFLRARNAASDLVGDPQLDASRLLTNVFLALPLLQDFADFPVYRAIMRGEMPNLTQLINPKEGADMFGRISRRLPEGTFLMLHGVMLEQLDRYAEAEQAFQAALAAPAFTHVRQRALYGLIEVRFALGASKKPFDPARRKQIVADLDELHRLGPLPPVQASDIINLALALGEPLLALEFARDGLLKTPNNLHILRWQAIAENRFGAYERVRATATEILKKYPADAMATNLFNSAARNLRMAGERVKDAPELLPVLPKEEDVTLPR
jgi:tetratricopeptide (TPR) repeat protein